MFYIRDKLGITEEYIGYIFAIGAIGSIIGSLLIIKLREIFGLGKLYIVTLFLLSFSYTISQSIYFIGTIFCLNCAFSCVKNLCVWSYRQESTDIKYIGRISGLTGSIFKIGLPFALFFLGSLDNITNYNNYFIFSCLLILYFSFISCRKIILDML